MKKLLLLVLPVLLLFACGQSTPETTKIPESVSKTVTFSGKIDSPKNDKVALRGANDFSQEAKLNEDGTFSMTFDIEEAGTYSFRHGGERTSIYLEPGNTIQVSLNPAEFDETITYTGDGAIENNYLVTYYLKNENLFPSYKNLYSEEVATFKEKMTGNYKELKQNLASYAKAHPKMDKDFIAREQSNLKYEQFSNLLNYKAYHNYYAKKEIKLEDSYYDFLTDAELHNEKLMTSSNYKNFLKSYMDARLKTPEMEKDPALKDMPNGETIAEFKAIDKHFRNEKIRNYLFVNAMNGAIKYGSLDNIEDLIVEYNQLSSNEEDKEEVTSNFKKWANLVKGKPAPNFSGVKTNGEKVSLTDLRNKVVYVDVWATWCGPCKKELPYLEEIESAYQGNKDIAFVSISIDKNKEAWEKMVTDKNMQGIQIYTENAWKSSITRDYLIKGIPRFMLIDKEGKILDARAPRPSSDKIKTQLTKLVGKGNYKMMSIK